MATQTVTLTKAQVVAAIQTAALTQAGIDPAMPGLTVSVHVINDLDFPAHATYPRASVTVTTP